MFAAMLAVENAVLGTAHDTRSVNMTEVPRELFRYPARLRAAR